MVRTQEIPRFAHNFGLINDPDDLIKFLAGILAPAYIEHKLSRSIFSSKSVRRCQMSDGKIQHIVRTEVTDVWHPANVYRFPARAHIPWVRFSIIP